MIRATLQLIPVMIAAAAVPICIVLLLLLLRSPDGLFKACAFVSGQIMVRLVQAIGFGSEMGFSAVAHTKQGLSGIINTLIVMVGILMWITAGKAWAKQEDPDAPPPWWMARVSSFSRLKAFGLGIAATAGAGKQWIFIFYALGVIRAADLPGLQNLVPFVVFILGAQSLVLLPIVLAALLPRHSAQILEAATLWFERNNQTIVIVISIIFGTFFVFKGITGFLR